MIPSNWEVRKAGSRSRVDSGDIRPHGKLVSLPVSCETIVSKAALALRVSACFRTRKTYSCPLHMFSALTVSSLSEMIVVKAKANKKK